MKLKTNRVIGTIAGLSGTVVMLFNYAWLLGLADKAPDDLFCARWEYAFCAYGVAIFCLGPWEEFP